DFKLPEEVERALRNMCGLPRPPRKKGAAAIDPAADLVKSFKTAEEFRAQVASRLALWRRTKRLAEFEGSDDSSGRAWLKDTFTRINNGRHDEFTLPGRITVTVPFDPVPGTPFEITLIDTRGVDGSAIRPDIIGQFRDQRTLLVLCSKFN